MVELQLLGQDGECHIDFLFGDCCTTCSFFPFEQAHASHQFEDINSASHIYPAVLFPVTLALMRCMHISFAPDILC